MVGWCVGGFMVGLLGYQFYSYWREDKREQQHWEQVHKVWERGR